MRTPHFVTESMEQAEKLSFWLVSHFEELKLKASEVSQHCKLQALEPWFVGMQLFLRSVLSDQNFAESLLGDMAF